MKTTKFLSACLLLLPFMSCTQVSDTKDKAVENKVDKLLSKDDVGGEDRSDEPDQLFRQH